jgi:hypothetical protein
MTTWHRNTDHYARSVMLTVALTRNPVPAAWLSPIPVSVDQIMALTPDQERRMVCTHEAAHAVVYMAYGHRIEYIAVHEDQGEHGCKAEMIPAVAYGEWWEFALHTACGERASDRWLREAGLWTPERAWAVEREAGEDRARTAEYVDLGAHAEMTYGSAGREHTDYAVIGDQADAILDRFWPQVLRLAGHLFEHGAVDTVTAERVAGFDLSSPDATL